MMKGLYFFFALLVILWVAHHSAVYIHEWTHGTVAWLSGYKSSPFAIHYGSKWFTLWDIDEAVPYDQILADGKPGVLAAIAITPLLLQAGLFLVGLNLLKRASFNRWVFVFVYLFALFEICEIYAYIPIRTFTPHADVYHFLYATGLSPWVVAIPGTLFAFWGIRRMLVVEVPRACSILAINSKVGKWTFLSANILFSFLVIMEPLGLWSLIPLIKNSALFLGLSSPLFFSIAGLSEIPKRVIDRKKNFHASLFRVNS